MRKKTLFRTILPLCIVALTALCISLSTVFATATASEPTWNINTSAYSKVLPRQSVLAIPDGNKATIDGTDYALKSTVVYPSGKTNSGDKVILTELGEYTVIYTFADGSHPELSKEHTFVVENTTESLFSLSENCDVVSGAEVPDYIVNGKITTIDNASVPYNGKTKGVKVTAHGESAVLRYEGVIDASKIDVNTDLIDLMVTPEVFDEERGEGVLEFKDGAAIKVRFYDAVYTDINLTFKLGNYDRRNTAVAVTANDNVSGVGLGNRFYNTTSGAGSVYCQSSFYGTFNPDGNNGGYWPGMIASDILPTTGAHRPTTSSLHLRYDATTNAAYSYPNEPIYVSEAGGYPQAVYDKDVRGHGSPFNRWVPNGYFFSDGNWDFDDYHEFNRGDEFYGFPSGMIKMEITFPSLGRGSGSFIIFNIGGHDLATWEEESFETKVFVDTEGADEENLPEVIASKNSFYPVYDAYGYNYVQGILPTPSVKVYFDKKTDENLLPIINGVFPVTKTGKYYIEYTATPEPTVGDPVKKTLEVVAVDYRDYDVSYSINNLIPTSAFVGDKINLYNGIINFTSGGVNVSAEKSPFFDVVTEVYFGGKTIKITDADIDYFVANNIGKYSIVYSSVDYAGEKVFLAKRDIEVAKNTNVNIDSLILPKALVAGTTYQFPIPSAYLNTETGRVKASVVATVAGQDVTNTAYEVPKGTNEITVTYSATANNGTENVTTNKDYVLKIMENELLSDGRNFLSNYLTFGSAYKYGTYSEEEMPFVATNPTKDQKVEFINAINVRFFRLMFKLGATNSQNSMFEVVMTDALNPSQRVVLGFVQSSANQLDIYSVFDDGSKEYLGKASGNYTTTTLNLIVDGNGAINNGNLYLTKFTKYASGYDFTGFDSGSVYLSFGYSSGINSFGISNIAGQAFNQGLDGDFGKPVVYFDNELPSYRETDIGDSYVITLPYAYDVLNAIRDIKATIKYPDGSSKTINKNQDGFVLEFTSYGRYEIAFRATDYESNFVSVSKTVIVKDMSPPEITINGDIPSKIEVGTIFSLPSATATDKVGSKIDVSIYYSYKGRIRSLFADNDQYTNPIYFEGKGIYKIYYYAVGENGNRSIKTIIVEAI